MNPISRYWKDPETKKLKKKYIGRNYFPNDEQKRQQEEKGNGAIENLLLADVIFVISYSFITGKTQEEEKLYLLHFCKILGNRYAGHDWYFTFKTQLIEQEKNRSGDTDNLWRLIASFP